jgi:hypothetical protein
MRSHPIRRYQRVLGLFIMALFAMNTVRASQPASGISFSQIRYGVAGYSRLVQVSVGPGALYGSGYLNVERYEQGRAVDWVVRNLPVNGGAAVGDFDDSAVPIWLQTKIGIDLRGESYDELNYEDLVRTLHRENIKAPPVGTKPKFVEKQYLARKGLIDNAVSAALESQAGGPESIEPKSALSPLIAYVAYQTKGPEAHPVDVYVRPLDIKGERYRMEPSNGESVEGTLAEVAQRYLMFDQDLRRKGYSRMRTFSGSGGQNFSLP